MLPQFHSSSDRRLFAGVILLAVLTVPQMLCLPLTADTLHYDVQADCALNGGVLYRDILEPNLPGVVWVHMLVRSVAGWSSEVMRAFDLLMLLGICVLLLHCLKPIPTLPSPPGRGAGGEGDRMDIDSPLRAGSLILLIWCCYLSLPEWCHCQRDIWMLLPALGAMSIRFARMGQSSPRWWSSSLIEGLLWGCGFWLKPFVAVPAICTWICWAVLTSPKRERGERECDSPLEQARLAATGLAQCVRDAGGLIAGGLIAGGLGVAWLWSTGAWGPFWDVATNWNPEYFASRQNRWTLDRIATLYQWLTPWWWAHLAAVPIAVGRLFRLHRNSVLPSPSGRGAGGEGHERDALMSAFYLGWLMQVMLLQHPLLYIHASGVLLALGIAGDALMRRLSDRPEFRPLVAGAAVMLALTSPALQWNRVGCWWTSLSQGSTDAVQDTLQRSPIVDYTQLRPVVDFLKSQDLDDGELTVYSGYLVGLYRELDLAPSTRFVLLDVEARVFSSRADEMTAALDRSSQRFVVTNLLESGFDPDQVAGDAGSEPRLPDGFPADHLTEFPFNQRLVFRSGPYLVHEVVAPVGNLTTEYLPLAN